MSEIADINVARRRKKPRKSFPVNLNENVSQAVFEKTGKRLENPAVFKIMKDENGFWGDFEFSIGESLFFVPLESEENEDPETGKIIKICRGKLYLNLGLGAFYITSRGDDVAEESSLFSSVRTKIRLLEKFELDDPGFERFKFKGDLVNRMRALAGDDWECEDVIFIGDGERCFAHISLEGNRQVAISMEKLTKEQIVEVIGKDCEILPDVDMRSMFIAFEVGDGQFAVDGGKQ